MNDIPSALFAHRDFFVIKKNVVFPAGAAFVAWHTPGQIPSEWSVCLCVSVRVFIMNAPRAHLGGRQERRSTTYSLYRNHHTQIIGSIKVS